MKPWMLIGVALVAGGVFLVHEVKAPADDTTRPHTAEPTASTASTTNPSPPGHTAPPAIAKPAPPERVEERSGEPEREQILERAERAFLADRAPTDNRKLEIEDQVRAVLPAGSTVRSVACRSELCRIETAHPSLTEFQRFTDTAFANHDSKLAANPVMATILGDPVAGQPVVAVAFIGRQGSDALSLATADKR